MTEIGKEYGTALFMVACEKNSKKEFAQALENIKQIFSENAEYLDFLISPSVSINERLSAINSAFAGSIPEDVLSYLMLLCEKGRMACFYESVDEYNALLNASEHLSNATVTSAVELSAEEKQKLVTKLEEICKGKVNVEYLVDSSLIGGIIVNIEGKIMDGSLRRRLRDIKEVIDK